jgi:hypothetical protein
MDNIKKPVMNIRLFRGYIYSFKGSPKKLLVIKTSLLYGEIIFRVKFIPRLCFMEYFFRRQGYGQVL